MFADYANFPFRKSGAQSPAIESRPIVIYGDERYRIISDMGACVFCMEFCTGRCRHRFRRCFYCERLEGSQFVDLRPKDEGHHSASCSVPDRRPDAKRRIKEFEEARRQIIGELQRHFESGSQGNSDILEDGPE
ncbi:unnamed protein product [Nippostrongylus brasiliensis]|uniref:C3HC-type domain-containing protein n=1 Tax=Nippostrongylus brasiliensis TaxID=27835 RepID=A0A0N4XFM2_NIPBR|nr:unnamed protein product [Nippostrongylus brasiliensis]